MSRQSLLLLALFAAGCLVMGVAWLFGFFGVLGAVQIFDPTPSQSTALRALLWWSAFAPPTYLIGSLVLVLNEVNGKERPRHLLWRHASPFFGAVLVTGVTWGIASWVVAS